MNILATNDDGITSDGIEKLSEALRKAGHRVLVVAPDRNRSGVSHALSFSDGIAVKKLSDDKWVCTGTPADCVIAAIAGGIAFSPDAVVSGINAGANLGTDIVYSGTAAAARQAVISGIPGLAFSLAGEPPYKFETAALWAAARFEELLSLWSADVFINVNFPPAVRDNEPWALCVPSRRRYTDKFSKKENGGGWTALRFDELLVKDEAPAGSDTALVKEGRVALSLVHTQPSARVKEECYEA
jgi:5'-nucleotidase